MKILVCFDFILMCRLVNHKAFNFTWNIKRRYNGDKIETKFEN